MTPCSVVEISDVSKEPSVSIFRLGHGLGDRFLHMILIYTRLHSVTSQETACYVLYVFKLTLEVLMKVDELHHFCMYL
jgi:hypothetical protein